MLGDCFDPKREILVSEHCRPHWSQAGAIVFITFRTQDSIPREVVQRWELEMQDWLQRRGLANGSPSRLRVPQLSPKVRIDFHKVFDRCREDFLDTCRGECHLKRPELGQIVANSLLHFDGIRYRMGDFVVMPNHVHLLAVFPTEAAMRKQSTSWLHYTTVEINRAIGSGGHFWQEEPFDHLVRSTEQYEYLRDYIAKNPEKAGLKPGEFIYRRYEG